MFYMVSLNIFKYIFDFELLYEREKKPQKWVFRNTIQVLLRAMSPCSLISSTCIFAVLCCFRASGSHIQDQRIWVLTLKPGS